MKREINEYREERRKGGKGKERKRGREEKSKLNKERDR